MRWLLISGLLSACELTPSYVDRIDIDDAFARSSYKTVCKGLEMKEDDTRRYATERLIQVEDPIAGECICTNIVDEKDGWDDAVAAGLTGTERDELASCFTELVKKPDLPKRIEAVAALSKIPARVSRDTLAEIAVTPGDSAVRVRAAEAIAGDSLYKEQQLQLASDSDTAVRAAAIGGLGAVKDDADVLALLRKTAVEDAEGAVRASALRAVKKLEKSGADDLMCTAMMKDESAEVRSAAVGAFRGTKRDEPIACLRERAMTFEEDAGVRDALLGVLKSSPNKGAAKILCDAIPFWMKSYVLEELPEKLPGTSIVQAQNDRDWDNSYACLQRAYAKRGSYSCYGKMHVALWFREVGGTSHVPGCPGYEAPEP